MKPFPPRLFPDYLKIRPRGNPFPSRRPGKGQSFLFVEPVDAPALELLGRGPGDPFLLADLLADLADGRLGRLAVDPLFPQVRRRSGGPRRGGSRQAPAPAAGKGLVVEIAELADIFKHPCRRRISEAASRRVSSAVPPRCAPAGPGAGRPVPWPFCIGAGPPFTSSSLSLLSGGFSAGGSASSPRASRGPRPRSCARISGFSLREIRMLSRPWPRRSPL